MRKEFMLVFLFLISITNTFSQNEEGIKGRIIDKTSKEPLIGVSVVLESSKTVGATTDLDGYFTINTQSGVSLLISYLGYEQMVVNAANDMLVELQPKVSVLDEVVVVGYGAMKKSDLTGALSSIKGSDLTVLSTPNVLSALTGRAAGVQVVNSGAVDGRTKVRIRGIGTINNSDPLYVVDGFPTGDISYVAPTDIESMEVLKDASATAIYGSRGANGVIMITTKKGISQKPVVTVNTYHGARYASKYLDVLDGKTYAGAMYENSINSNMALSPKAKAAYDNAINNNLKGTDWQKEITQIGTVHNYNGSIVGGSENARYNLSTTYNTEEGVLKNSYVDKFYLRMNADYKLSKIFTLGVDASVVSWKGSVTELDNLYGSAMTVAVRADPVYPVFNQRGNWQDIGGPNPVRLNQFVANSENSGEKFLGNFFLDAKIIKGLTFKTTLGLDRSYGRSKSYSPVFFVSQSESNYESALSESRGDGFSYSWSNILTYNIKFNNVHDLTAMVGYEQSEGDWYGISARATNVDALESMQYFSASKSNTDKTPTSTQSVSSLQSYFSRLNYSFDNRYLLTATIRRDGSSRFSKKNRWGTFPSMSLGWNIKEEAFMEDIDFLNQFKIRAGWGKVGNQSSTGIYDYISVIDNGLKYVMGDEVYEGRAPKRASNPNLRWEISEQTDIGTDISLFDTKLQLTVDYFIKKTKDMIVREPQPSFAGVDWSLANVGTMENKGWELSVNHENRLGDFKYNAGFNFSFIDNEVTDLGKSDVGSYDRTVYDRFPSSFRTEVGREIAYYRGHKMLGIFNTQEELDGYVHTDENGVTTPIQPNAQLGDVMYADLNKDGKIGEEDRTYLGSYIPDFSGGFNLGAEYKGFFFSALFDFVYGNQIANMAAYELTSGVNGTNILQSYYDNHWTPEHPERNQPRLTRNSGEIVKFSDRYIEDGSFFRIRNMQLGYDFPAPLLQTLKLKKCKIYLSADNLATFTKYTGYNPEISDQFGDPLKAGGDTGSAPLPVTVSVGLNLSF